MNFFSKKDNTLLEERTRLTRIYLQQQKEENSELRKELNNLKELSLRNKLLLDDLLKSVNSNEKIISSITESNISLQSTIAANEEMITKLEDEIKQLRGVKNTLIPTDFFLGATQTEGVQEILDKASANGEIICFKDINGSIWQLLKGEEFEPADEDSNSNINEITININLNP